MESPVSGRRGCCLFFVRSLAQVSFSKGIAAEAGAIGALGRMVQR